MEAVPSKGTIEVFVRDASAALLSVPRSALLASVEVGPIAWEARQVSESANLHLFCLDGILVEHCVTERVGDRVRAYCTRGDAAVDELVGSAWLFFEMFSLDPLWTLLDGADSKQAVWSMATTGAPAYTCRFDGRRVSESLVYDEGQRAQFLESYLRLGSRPFWSEDLTARQFEWALSLAGSRMASS